MWQDRTLFQGPRFAVVTSQEQFQAVLDEMGTEDADSFCDPSWFACVNSYNIQGELVCIVGLNLERMAGEDPIDIAGHLVHEATHVWQYTRRALGPGGIGDEMEAYAVQNIATRLMRAYVEATRKSHPG